MKKFDVLGCGSVLKDQLIYLPVYPKADTKIEIQKTQSQLGGPVPIALKILSKLGLQTSFIGKVGSGENAVYIKNKLTESGISVENLIIENSAESGFSQIWIDQSTGSRTIAYSGGSLSILGADEISKLNLPETHLLHIDGRNHEAALCLIDRYKEKDTLISIDTGNFREETLNLLKYVDIVIMPKTFAYVFFAEENLNKLILQAGKKFNRAKMIVITDGVNGSICWHNQKVYQQPAFKVKTIDSTGAGDVHAGAVLYGIYKNWHIINILRYAAATAALKCTTIGNTNLPTSSNINDFIKNYSTSDKLQNSSL